MFGKKKKDAPVLESTGTDETTPVQEKKGKKEKPAKKKKNTLAQVFHTSVFETILEDLRVNDAFIVRKDGKTLYIALCLNTNDVGGMDRKSAKKDEAKGSIIEKINGGRIKVYLTDELMAEDLMVFIPEPVTMSEMDEFSLLTDAPYEFCAIDVNGDIELLDIHTNYNDVCSVITDEGHVSDLMGSYLDDGETDSNADIGETLADTVAETVSESAGDASFGMLPDPDPSSVADGVPDLDDIEDIDNIDGPVDDVVPVDAGMQAAPGVPYDEPAVGSDNGFGTDVPPDVPAAEGPLEKGVSGVQPEEEQELDSSWTADALVRKFYADELGLEVTTQPFDVQFMVDNPFIPFDENRPEGWLNENLNEMSRQANLELARLHEEHLFLLRERYFRLVSMQCDRIRDDLNIYSEDTQYGQLYRQIQNERAENEGDIYAKVERRKSEMEAEWKERLQKVGMDAARAAQREYRNKYQEKHDAKLAHLEDTVKASYEADFEDKKKEILDQRRMEALTLLDLGITETLNEISDMYVAFMEDEKIRYQELRENMRVFRDDLMTEDIKRTHVLEEELRQTDKADQVLAEQTAKIRALTDDFAQKKQSLHMEIEKMRADNQARIDAMKQDSDARVDRVLDEKAAVQKQFEELLDNYKGLESQVEQKYQRRVDELKDEVASSNERCEYLTNSHARSNRISIFLMVAAVIAALAIGFVGGEFVNSNRQVKMYQQQMYQQMLPEARDAEESK